MLARDEGRCRVCGECDPAQILVHHRRPGISADRLLITLCRRCHVRVHRTLRPLFGCPAMLRALWRELHRGLPEQRLLWHERTKAGSGEQMDLLRD